MAFFLAVPPIFIVIGQESLNLGLIVMVNIHFLYQPKFVQNNLLDAIVLI